MNITIYRAGAANTTVKINESTTRDRRVNGEDIVRVKTVTREPLDIELGDTITVEGQQYTLNRVPSVKKVSRHLFEYDMTFESNMYELSKVILLDNHRSEFYLMTDAGTLVDLIISNLNRVYPSPNNWTKGAIASTNTRNLQFSNENCLEVLQKAIQEFDLYIDIVGRQIALNDSSGASTGETFEYGKGKGLYSLVRQNVGSKNMITHLYAYGSDKNLPSNYRDYSKRLMFATPPNHYLQANIDLYGRLEGSEIFDDIYPKRTGTIGSAPSTLSFVDTGIDFDLNSYLLPGVPAKVHFNTGNMAGYEFEIVTYDNSTKTVTVKAYEDQNGDTLPSLDYGFAAGDEYVFLDITMPASYVTAAETELMNRANEYLHKNAQPRVKYNLEVDPSYAKTKNILPDPGDYMTVIDGDLQVNREIRIQTVSQQVMNPYAYRVDLSDEVEIPLLTQLHSQALNLHRGIRLDRDKHFKDKLIIFQREKDLENDVFDEEGTFHPDKIKGRITSDDGLTFIDLGTGEVQGKVTVRPGSNGYGNIVDRPAALTDINTDEGTKLTGVEAGATNGADYIDNVTRKPTALADINATEGTKLTGVEAGATNGADYIDNVTRKPAALADINLTEGNKLTSVEENATAGADFNVNLANKPIALGDINTTEGSKLTGVESGATAGADFNVNLANKPTALADINLTEGNKLTGVESGATAGADYVNNVTNKPTALADINATEGTKLTQVEEGATKSHTYYSTTTPTAGATGDLWYNSTTKVLKRWDGTAWLDVSTVGADYIDNVTRKPTALADINSAEGTKLTGVEAGATVGADYIDNVTRKPAALADINLTEGNKLTGVADNADVTSANTAAGISGQGALATKNDVDYGTEVAGTKPPANADRTADNTAAGISGQGALATKNDVDYDTEVTGTKPPANADRTETVIEGGLVTTGRIELGGSTTVTAGINGSGTADSEIRIWAGSDYANRATAPFRVNQAGGMVSTSGVIGGFTITASELTGGKMRTADETVSANRAIVIDSSDNALKFYPSGSLDYSIFIGEYSGNSQVYLSGGDIHISDNLTTSDMYITGDDITLDGGRGKQQMARFISHFEASDGGTALEGSITSDYSGGNNSFIGVLGGASGQKLGHAVGVKGIGGAWGAGSINYGVYGEAIRTGTYKNYGGYFIASGAGENRAIISFGNVQMLSLPAKTTETKAVFSDADGNLALGDASAVGGVSADGTPSDNQVAIWTGPGTIEGLPGLTYESNVKLDVAGSVDVSAVLTVNGATRTKSAQYTTTGARTILSGVQHGQMYQVNIVENYYSAAKSVYHISATILVYRNAYYNGAVDAKIIVHGSDTYTLTVANRTTIDCDIVVNNISDNTTRMTVLRLN